MPETSGLEMACGFLAPCLHGDAVSAVEILWEARLHPHRRGSTMTDDERRELNRAIRAVFGWACPMLEVHVRDGLWQRIKELRERLCVHREAAEPCFRCGKEMRGRTSGGRETNFCLGCQLLDFERRTLEGATRRRISVCR